MKEIIFTIVSNNYLGSALSLYDSVLMHCKKDMDFACLISDKKDPRVDYENLKFTVLWPEYFLGENTIHEMAFKYDVVEYNTALKPFAINYMMHQLGYERVYYFDPDTYLFDGIESLEKKLEEKDIILTPHVVSGIIQPELRGREEIILKNGVYNLGFLGMNRSKETEKILDWWIIKLKNQCYDDRIYFVDQKWMSFVPAFTDNVCVLKDKIYNVAKWNYHERNLSEENGTYFVDGKRLCFFHFSSYKAEEAKGFVERQFTYANNKDVLEKIFGIYQKELIKNNFAEYRKIPYSYNFYDDGMAISKLNRRLYRQLLDEGIRFDNPFKTGNHSFYNIMKKNGLLSNVYKTNELKAAISNSEHKGKLQKILNGFMRIVKKLIGAKKYELLLGYFNSSCTIDNQRFLLTDKSIASEIIKND